MRRARLLSLTAVCVSLCAAAPGSVATAPPNARHAALRGACYYRAAGEFNRVGGVTQAECKKQCA